MRGLDGAGLRFGCLGARLTGSLVEQHTESLVGFSIGRALESQRQQRRVDATLGAPAPGCSALKVFCNRPCFALAHGFEKFSGAVGFERQCGAQRAAAGQRGCQGFGAFSPISQGLGIAANVGRPLATGGELGPQGLAGGEEVLVPEGEVLRLDRQLLLEAGKSRQPEVLGIG